MSFTETETDYLAHCLEGGLFGIYSGLFAVHLALHATKRETADSKPNVIFYALCVLYVLTGAVFAIDTANGLLSTLLSTNEFDDVNVFINHYDGVAGGIIFGCCDFIAQCILIHRCWIVYGQNIRVIIVPSILALAYLALWGSTAGGQIVIHSDVDDAFRDTKLVWTSLITSMTVNALVTSLIVFRIFKVFKSVTTLEDQSLGITHGNKLRSVTFIIIESGMALFAIQLARVLVTIFQTDAANNAFQFIPGIHEMVNGIAPTIILVRVSLGLSFHDKQSLEEAVGSLQFAANPIPAAGTIDQDRSLHIGDDDDLNPLPVTGDINQERTGDDEIGESDDIQIVDR